MCLDKLWRWCEWNGTCLTFVLLSRRKFACYVSDDRWTDGHKKESNEIKTEFSIYFDLECVCMWVWVCVWCKICASSHIYLIICEWRKNCFYIGTPPLLHIAFPLAVFFSFVFSVKWHVCGKLFASTFVEPFVIFRNFKYFLTVSK